MDFPVYLLRNSAADGRPTSVWMLPTFLPEDSVNDSSTKPQEVLAAVSSVGGKKSVCVSYGLLEIDV